MPGRTAGSDDRAGIGSEAAAAGQVIEGVAFDHVALAVERWPDAWPRYAVELGGDWASGGLNVGFGPAQLRYANGARIEILQPWKTDDNPFLRRFLDQHGPGPHHLTFKVPDLVAGLGAARAAGFTPVGVDVSHPDWMEAFIHPRQATGIVVQLAQAAVQWESPSPEGFPTQRRIPPSAIVRATHAVADMARGMGLFHDLLGGHLEGRGRSPDGAWEYADLSWPGPPVLRLVAPTHSDRAPAADELAVWLAGRPGRLHHLVVSRSDPARVAGAAPAPAVPGWGAPGDGQAWVVEPADNLGTRLVLVSGADDAGATGEDASGAQYPGPVGEEGT